MAGIPGFDSIRHALGGLFGSEQQQAPAAPTGAGGGGLGLAPPAPPPAPVQPGLLDTPGAPGPSDLSDYGIIRKVMLGMGDFAAGVNGDIRPSDRIAQSRDLQNQRRQAAYQQAYDAAQKLGADLDNTPQRDYDRKYKLHEQTFIRLAGTGGKELYESLVGAPGSWKGNAEAFKIDPMMQALLNNPDATPKMILDRSRSPEHQAISAKANDNAWVESGMKKYALQDQSKNLDYVKARQQFAKDGTLTLEERWQLQPFLDEPDRWNRSEFEALKRNEDRLVGFPGFRSSGQIMKRQGEVEKAGDEQALQKQKDDAAMDRELVKLRRPARGLGAVPRNSAGLTQNDVLRWQDVYRKRTTPLGVAYTEKGADTVRKFYESDTKMEKMLGELLALRAKYGQGYRGLSPAKKANAITEMQRLATNIKTQIKEVDKLGVPSVFDYQLLERQLPDNPAAYDFTAGDPALVKLKGALRDLQGARDATVSSFLMPKDAAAAQAQQYGLSPDGSIREEFSVGGEEGSPARSAPASGGNWKTSPEAAALREQRKSGALDEPQFLQQMQQLKNRMSGAGGQPGIVKPQALDEGLIQRAAKAAGVDPELVRAIAQQESAGDPNAVSVKGARGLMQLMPGTAAELGVTDVNDPEQNVHAGARYLKQQLDKYNGNVDLALAAYNAGPGAVDKHGGIPPYPQTQNYVKKVRERSRKRKRVGL